MAADTTRLQGELADESERSSRDIERLIVGFLRSLLNEQKLQHALSPVLSGDTPSEEKEAR